MTTPQSNPLELAKQGNIQAIAFLINRSLAAKGITAKVALKDGFLQVMLESAQVPDQAVLVSLIYKGITNLGIESISKLKVYGKKIDENRPTWSREFGLLEEAEPLNTRQVGASRHREPPTSQLNLPTPLTSSKDEIQDKEIAVKDQASAAPETAMIRQGCFGCLGISFLVIIGLYVVGLVVGNNRTTSPASTSPALSSPVVTERKPEELLAGIDGQPEKEAEYAILLDQLMPKCQEERMLLADMSVKTQELLSQKGARASNIQILNAAYQNVKPYNEPQKCAAAFALISTVVNK